MKRLMLMGALLAVVALSVAVTASAAKHPKPSPVYSISLNQPDPVFGQTVTFTTTSDQFVWIQVQCFQAGSLVYSQIGQTTDSYQLGPTSLWQSGGADCEAGIWNQSNGFLGTELALTRFAVTG